jgi:PilZ domain
MTDQPEDGALADSRGGGASSGRAPRSARMLLVEMMGQDGTRHRLRLRNLSETGLGGVSDALLNCGDLVKICLPNIPPVQGEIIWRSGKSFGISFETSVDLDLVLVPKETGQTFVPRPLHIVSNEQYRPAIKPRK